MVSRLVRTDVQIKTITDAKFIIRTAHQLFLTLLVKIVLQASTTTISNQMFFDALIKKRTRSWTDDPLKLQCLWIGAGSQ